MEDRVIVEEVDSGNEHIDRRDSSAGMRVSRAATAKR